MPTNAKILGFHCLCKLVKKDCGIRSIDRFETVSHKKLLAFGRQANVAVYPQRLLFGTHASVLIGTWVS